MSTLNVQEVLAGNVPKNLVDDIVNDVQNVLYKRVSECMDPTWPEDVSERVGQVIIDRVLGVLDLQLDSRVYDPKDHEV